MFVLILNNLFILQANDAAVQALYNGFTGSLGQPHSNQSQQHFHHSQVFIFPLFFSEFFMRDVILQ